MDQALDYAKKANELTKQQNPNYLDTLALVYASRGDFELGVQIAQQALTLSLSQNQTALSDSLQKSLEQYKKRSLP